YKMTDKKPFSQLEREFIEGKIPYAVDKKQFKRFSARNVIFSRVAWDESFPMYMRSISEREQEKVGRKGYSRIGYAADDASWTVYDHFRGAFNWTSVKGEDAKTSTSPTQLISHLPKFESTDLNYNSKSVKRVAQIFGACNVGITKIDPDQTLIYSHNARNEPINLPEGIEYAIVCAIEMDYDGIGTSPTLPAAISTGNGYSRMAFLIACMAQFLRNLGYQAVPAGNDTGLSVPLAVQAGLGQFGRNGLLVTPKFGQRIRLCKVYTDFPMEIDEPIDFGVTQFCRVCKKCAKYCPSQSIPYDNDPTWESPWETISNNPGAYKWYVNAETCYEYWVKNSCDCSNCIRVCPFTKPEGFAHDVARFFVNHFRFLDRFWLKLDDLMAIFPWWRYGKKKNPEKFWKSKKFLDKKSYW
ncbi:MAG: reductive dehalogenase, partial [Candidatus Hodarchaeales archaeon]